MPPRGPEEAWKNLRTCSPKERKGFSTLPGALCSHKDCLLSGVAVWPELPPSRVWKGESPHVVSQSKQKYITDSKAACTDKYKRTRMVCV